MRRDKMDKVAAVAKLAENETARELGASQQSHQAKVAQLEQLLQFRADYESSLQEKGRQGITANQLQDHRVFLARLNQAVEQQTREVAQAEQEMVRVRGEWLAKSRRTSALDQLVDERARARARASDKAEQKRADERAMLGGELSD